MTYHLFPQSNYDGQINDEVSMTVPDQTMDIRTILEKYARGENFNQFEPIFSDEDNQGIDIRRLDLSEIHELKMNNDAEIKRMQQDLEKSKSQADADDLERTIQSRAKHLMEQNLAGSKETSSATGTIPEPNNNEKVKT